ncbi:MAG: hypothetical protein ACLTZY_15000 [Alistipes indistinctus]
MCVDPGTTDIIIVMLQQCAQELQGHTRSGSQEIAFPQANKRGFHGTLSFYF